MQKRRTLPLAWGIALSLAFHAFVLFFYLPAVTSTKQLAEQQRNNEPIEVTQVPEEVLRKASKKDDVKVPKLSREMEMAETEDAGNREIDPNAKFLSDRNQKAQQQMRAKSIDDFRKKEGTGLKTDERNKKNAGGMAPTADAKMADTPSENPDGQGVPDKAEQSPGIKRNWKTLSLKDLSVSGDGGVAAASDDRLNGVSDGDQTVLSTREFKFFSYYQRIKELLRQFWKPNVERKLAKLYAGGKNVGDREVVTQLLVLLDDKGQVQKISRVGTSGFDDLDDAAIEAFKKAAPFPNPPKGIIDQDGFARVRWDFILRTESAPRIQFGGAGGGGGGPR